jgi:dTDP-4-dehydrorhamnose reductase
MAQKRILILGAKGLLGAVLTVSLKKSNLFEVLTHSHSSAADYNQDMADYKEVSDLLLSVKPDFCINLLALTDVDICENEKHKAYQLNVAPVKNIVTCILSHKLNLKLVQISTDHVYDKQNSTEMDVKIVNYYALTKYVADEFSQLVNSVVLRTNFFGKSLSKKRSFSDWIVESLEQKKSIRGFSDVYFAPLHMSTLVTEIENVILNFIPGIHNLGSKEGMSKYSFIVELSKHKGFTEEFIKAVVYKDSGIKIQRPLDMRMDVSKYERTFKTTLPRLLEEIHKC